MRRIRHRAGDRADRKAVRPGDRRVAGISGLGLPRCAVGRTGNLAADHRSLRTVGTRPRHEQRGILQAIRHAHAERCRRHECERPQDHQTVSAVRHPGCGCGARNRLPRGHLARRGSGDHCLSVRCTRRGKRSHDQAAALVSVVLHHAGALDTSAPAHPEDSRAEGIPRGRCRNPRAHGLEDRLHRRRRCRGFSRTSVSTRWFCTTFRLPARE